MRTVTICVLAAMALGMGAAIYLDVFHYLWPVANGDFDEVMRRELDAAKLPGVSIALFKDGKVVFTKGYGYADLKEGRAANSGTIFQIASVSKLATATALMRLYQKKAFQLDDDINQYLPFKVRHPLFPDTHISFRMLLTHTSGISDGPAYDKAYTLGVSEDPVEPLEGYLSNYFTLDGRDYDVKNFAASKPGEEFHYSNVSYALIAYLVERISGLPFDTFCEREVFSPLGMNNTNWFYRNVDKAKTAVPYGYSMWRKQYYPLGFYSASTYPDGMLKTSVEDFSQLVFVYLNRGVGPDGSQFLQQEIIEEMLRVQNPGHETQRGLAWGLDTKTSMFSLYGSDPGVSSVVSISPKERWGFIILTNGGGFYEGLRSFAGFLLLVKRITPVLKTSNFNRKEHARYWNSRLLSPQPHPASNASTAAISACVSGWRLPL